MQHTTCTQPAHNMHTICTHRKQIQNKRQNNMQHTEQDTEKKDKEQHTETLAQPQQNSAHNFSTYSLDYYFEYAYIKNSNTIELYTILQENI